MKKIDPAAELRNAVGVLSRTEIERAWTAADAANKVLGGNPALRAEAAAYLLATILGEIGSTTTRPDDLADVAAAVESVALYVSARMITIVAEIGSGNG